MKKMITLTFTLLLTTAIALAYSAQPSQDNEMTKKKSSKPAKAAAPTSDADIQKCISEKFAASKSIKNGAATVGNAQATLTGEAKSPGAKGGATRSAQACGAKKVTNNMTVAEVPKGAAK
ncbi:MAG: BON domain-containing protein [Blastocatellales bacterium]